MYFNYIYHITILKVEKLFIPFLVSCVTGGKIVLISKVNFVLLRLKQKKRDMITSVKLMLNKSRILNNGSYPLVFQVIHNRRKKLLYTGYRMKEEVFDESEGKIMNGVGSTFTATEVVKMNRELRKIRNQIDTRIRQLEPAEKPRSPRLQREAIQQLTGQRIPLRRLTALRGQHAIRRALADPHGRQFGHKRRRH